MLHGRKASRLVRRCANVWMLACMRYQLDRAGRLAGLLNTHLPPKYTVSPNTDAQPLICTYGYVMVT